MTRPLALEDSPRVLVVGLALWAAGAALAGWHDVFAALGPGVCAGVSIFAALYAIAAYALDAGLRRCLDEAGWRMLAAAALVLDAAVLAAGWEAWRAGLDASALTRLPWVPVPTFVAPLALVADVAAMRAALRVRPAPGRSPGATPAAT